MPDTVNLEVICSKVECTTVVLLSGHGIKQSSEYSCLYTKTSAAISLGQRSFWLQWRQLTQRLITAQNAENEWWWSAQCLMGHLYHPLQGSWNISEEGSEWHKIQGMKGVLWNTIFWTWHSHCPHELPASVVAYTRLDHVDTLHQGLGREFVKHHLCE